MHRKGLSELACRSRCINPSPLRVLGRGSSKAGFHSFTRVFFFLSAHTLSCQTLWAAGIPAYLFIYYPGALRMQPGLSFYYFILFFFYSEGDGGVLKLQQRQLLRALQGSRLGESHRPAPAKSAHWQLWPFGAVCMGCIKPNDVCLVFFFFSWQFFFFLNSDQYVQLPPLRPFAFLLRMLLFLFSQWLR